MWRRCCTVVLLGFAAACSGADAAPITPPVIVPAEPHPHPQPHSQRSSRPNFVVVVTDDQDLRQMHAMPALQALVADSGITFTHAMVPFALCCPSRTSILRGQYPHNHGVVDNGDAVRTHIGDQLGNSTIAVWLDDAGYRTGITGKYLAAYFQTDPTYRPAGWDEWFVTDQGYFNYGVNDNGVLGRMRAAPEDYSVDRVAGRAKRFIRDAVMTDTAPFFLYVTPFAPHASVYSVNRADGTTYKGPPIPAPRHAGTFAGAALPRPPSFNEEDLSDKPRPVRARPLLDDVRIREMEIEYQRRLESLRSVDEMVAGIVRTLDELGQLENTYIIYTSDNGFHLGEHRLYSGKRELIEEDVRVPLMVRGPGVARGGTSGALVGNIDLAPTIAALAGVTPPAFVDGISLVPLLRGGALPQPRQAFLLGAWFSNGRLRGHGLRTETHHYAEYSNGSRELYDLRSDPFQLDNLVPAADPGELARFSAWMREMATCSGSGCTAAARR